MCGFSENCCLSKFVENTKGCHPIGLIKVFGKPIRTNCIIQTITCKISYMDKGNRKIIWTLQNFVFSNVGSDKIPVCIFSKQWNLICVIYYLLFFFSILDNLYCKNMNKMRRGKNWVHVSGIVIQNVLHAIK